MIFEFLKLNISITDDDFDAIYPEKIRMLARKHWSSVSASKLASEFLVQGPGTRVLDIGSGAGKFCMIGATNTKGHFTGVEHANITSINFNDYDAFYFYNSFYENIDRINRIDNAIKLDIQLYHLYSEYILEQFVSLPLGTRLVSLCSPLTIIPQTFRLQDSSHDGVLKFWEKVREEPTSTSHS
jgi:SAM-dependent methyltransferase